MADMPLTQLGGILFVAISLVVLPAIYICTCPAHLSSLMIRSPSNHMAEGAGQT